MERGVLTLTWRRNTSVRRGSGKRVPQHFKLTPRMETLPGSQPAADLPETSSVPSSLNCWSERDEVDSVTPGAETPPSFGGNEVTDATLIATVVPAAIASIEGRRGVAQEGRPSNGANR